MKRGSILLKERPEFLSVDLESNKNIDFNKLSYRSGIRIWWICNFCKTKYFASPQSKTRSKGCLGCYKKKNPAKNQKNKSRKNRYDMSIAYLYPELAKLWHPTKNGDLKPENAKPSNKHWYICNKNHEFFIKASFKKKVKNINMCSRCLGTVISNDNNFATRHPEIAKEWDYKKNKKLPTDYSRASNYKAWWICKKNHSYKASIGARTGPLSGCNKCSPNISRAQIRVYAEVKSIFPKTKLKKIINKIEIDVFIPEINVGIEYDGVRYHKDHLKKESDLRKNKKLNKLGIHLIRIREKGLFKLTEDDILQVKTLIQKKEIDEVLIRIKKIISKLEYVVKINDYLSKSEFMNRDGFNKVYLNQPFPIFESSIAATHKHLLKEWDYKKNKKIKPEHFLASSPLKVWWICEKHKHSCLATIRDRAYKNAKCKTCNEISRSERFAEIARKRKGVKKEFWPDRKP
jgi:very-short-patch-repair endonuclease